MVRVNKEDDCPTQQYTPGKSAGQCWSDGHYLCQTCVHFRADFKKDPDLLDKLTSGQGGIQLSLLQPSGREIRIL